jgi:hypothetical protein
MDSMIAYHVTAERKQASRLRGCRAGVNACLRNRPPVRLPAYLPTFLPAWSRGFVPSSRTTDARRSYRGGTTPPCMCGPRGFERMVSLGACRVYYSSSTSHHHRSQLDTKCGRTCIARSSTRLVASPSVSTRCLPVPVTVSLSLRPLVSRPLQSLLEKKRSFS